VSKWGVSWGGRLFRVGQSPDGRWWGYFNILGFRFFRYFDENGKRRFTRNQNSIPTSYQQPIPPQPQQSYFPTVSQSPPVSTTPQPHEINTTGTPLEATNDKILEAIKKQQHPDSIN
jgi:hypothetical protein